MLTVQEIQAMTFEKAVFNGYDMKSVDKVMAQIAEDYAALQKENATLKAKMKVLVDKIDEYRLVEDGMRRALVSAQGIAQETLQKAANEAEQIRQEAEASALKRITELETQIALAEAKLETAKQNNADFLTKMTAVYDAQMKVLIKLSSCEEILPSTPAPATAAAAAQTVAPTAPEVAETASAVHPTPAEQPAESKTPAETLHEQTTARFNFGELKFGADYKPENDK